MGHIYLITNKINGLMYVGATTKDPVDRFNQHIRYSRRKLTIGRPLYDAIREFGKDNFDVSTLEVVDDVNNIPKLEMYYIDLYNTFEHGYNATYGGAGKRNVNYDEISKYYVTHKNESIKDLSRIFGISTDTISKILKTKEIPIRETKTYLSKGVLQIDRTTGDVVREFESERDAAKYMGNISRRRHIHEVCEGRRKSAYGFMWKYK